MQTPSAKFQTKTTNITPSPNEDKRRPLSKIPIRTNSSSQSRSRSPAVKPTTNRLDNNSSLRIILYQFILDIFNHQ